MLQRPSNSARLQGPVVVDMKIEAPRIRINQNACTGCGTCAEVCPFGLPARSESGKYTILRPDLCTECSACQKNCPEKAVVMQEQKGCGCLWDVSRRRIGTKKGTGGSCCG
ncbi:MAG: ATP-binding protein [Candidatus Sigynarchaeota archaeon]